MSNSKNCEIDLNRDNRYCFKFIVLHDFLLFLKIDTLSHSFYRNFPPKIHFRKPKVQLDVACVFSFEKKRVVIGVTNERNKFNVDHAELKYYAQSLKIGSVARVGNKFNFIVPLDELDRHVFETKYQIIFQYSVECLELKVPNNKVVLSATFKFEVNWNFA